MKTSYRNDIDGLRAIAVLSVILNHTGVRLVPGGFVGVDIFFVISGYLITGILLREIETHQFSLARFYDRRIRRILPALFPMIAFTVAVCALIYEPGNFSDFGESVIATTLFVSNIKFWTESGYFDGPSQLKPLLHTWSLAVEEQFYIFFPLFMAAVMRYARKFLPAVLIVMVLISFGAGLFFMQTDASAAFYLTPLRVWELLVGSLVAINFLPPILGKRFAGLLSFTGILLVLIPVFIYTENTPFPGFAALVPVLGTALILFTGQAGRSLTSDLLSLPFLVFIGKISYSLYLWHWPLIIFWKYYAIRPPTNLEMSLVLALILGLSVLSWRFIETPFRNPDFLRPGQIYALATGVAGIALATGIVIQIKHGFSSRYDVISGIAAADKGGHFEECYVDLADEPGTITPCKLGADTEIPSFLVWGDSHAPAIGKGIEISATQANVAGVMTYHLGCPTLLDVIPAPRAGELLCIDYNHMVLDYIDAHPEISTVILINRWTLWTEGVYYKMEGREQVFLADALGELPQKASNPQVFTLGLERLIKKLVDTDHDVFLIAPIPEIGYDVPSANFTAQQTSRDTNEIIAPTLDEYQSRNQATFSILHSLEDKYGIHVIEPWKILCADGVCRAVINGIPLYRDDDHLSLFGSEVIAPAFGPIFDDIR